MRNLVDLLYKVSISETIGSTKVEVNNIQFDSRKVSNDDVFVAVNGVTVDGHQYIEKAIGLGAKVIVCEVLPENLVEGVTYVKVENSTI
ncbi:MAG: Mur ligase domain-containing protein, partial [Empedobacter falsenii]